MMPNLKPQLGSGATWRNAAWLYLDQIVRAVLSLVVFSLVTRHLGAAQFGVLSYASAFPALLLPFANLGLDFAVVQELVRRPREAPTVLATSVLLLIASSALCLLAGVAYALAVPSDEPGHRYLWIAALALLGQPFQVFDFYAQSRLASKFTVIGRLSASLMLSTCRLTFVMIDAPLAWFVWLVAVDAVITGFGLWAGFRFSGAKLEGLWAHASRSEARRLLLTSWPLMLGGVAMAAYLRLDQMIISHLAGVEVLGRYAAAVRLGEAAQFISYAVINSTFPRLVTLHGLAGGEFLPAVRSFMRQMTWLSIGIAIVTTALAPWLVPMLLGPQFEGSVMALVVLVWSNTFAAQIGVRGKWLLLERQQHLSLLFFTGGAALHLLGVWLFVSRWGATGVAISFLLAQAAMALLLPLFLAKTRIAGQVAWHSLLPIHPKS